MNTGLLIWIVIMAVFVVAGVMCCICWRRCKANDASDDQEEDAEASADEDNEKSIGEWFHENVKIEDDDARDEYIEKLKGSGFETLDALLNAEKGDIKECIDKTGHVVQIMTAINTTNEQTEEDEPENEEQHEQ